MFEKINGLIAAVHTPMDRGCGLRLELVVKQAELLARNGLAGAFVCGTAGESMSLTVQERMAVAEQWAKTAPKGIKVIVHVGHTSADEARTMAAHAQKVGAWGTAALAPFYFKPADAAGLSAFCAAVASGAPELPFYYYHIPSMTGVTIKVFDFLRAAGASIPNLAGVKFTDSDFMDLALSADLDGGRYEILNGWDEMLICGLAAGAGGAVGGTYNFAAPLYLKLMEAFRAGDMDGARRLQVKSGMMIDCVRRSSAASLACFKAMMRMVGLDLGPVRSPVAKITEDQFSQLQAELKKIGFSEFCCK